MSDKKKKVEPDPISDNYVEIVRIDSRYRTIRMGFICFVVISGMACVTIGIIKMIEQPQWGKVFALLISCIFGPSGIIYLVIKAREKYIDKTHRRTVELENKLDENRTSSNLNFRKDEKGKP